MDIQNAASVIKDTVDMETVLALYGYQAKHGKMMCPFHADKNASLQIYKTNGRHSGWHCFGCGKGGSVIDFVMEHEGCDFITAVKAIDQALGMHLLETRNLFEMQKRKEDQEIYDRVKAEFDRFYDECRDQLDRVYTIDFAILHMVEEKDPKDRTADDWCDMEHALARMKYIDDLQDKIRENRKEVMAWRNQARRARSG